MTKKSLAITLTYLGAIPFYLSLFIGSWSIKALDVHYEQIVLTYGAIIVSFICGIHWGVYLFKDAPLNLFIHSNIVALIAWVAALLEKNTGIVVLILCFVYLLIIDKILTNTKILEEWYMQLRLNITLLVVLSLGGALVL